MAQTKQEFRELSELLIEMFSDQEFRRMMDTVDAQLLQGVVSPTEPLADLIAKSVEALARRGALDEGFFMILERERPKKRDAIKASQQRFIGTVPNQGLERITLDVPSKLVNELRTFVDNVVAIKRSGYIGLDAAERQLERLAGEFYKYRAPRYVVRDFSVNVTEAYSNAKSMIVACTTPSYFDDWRDNGGGRSLLYANEEFVRLKQGRVIRFFFVQDDDYERRHTGIGNILRSHVTKNVEAIVVVVSAYGEDVLKQVFGDGPTDLDLLECAFVDSGIFMRTIFEKDDTSVEVAQEPQICNVEYRQRLRPFLVSRPNRMFRATLAKDRPEEIVFGEQLSDAEVNKLRVAIEANILVKPTTVVPT